MAKTVANRITGEIVAVDSQSNLVTNITREMLAEVPTEVPTHETVAIR